MARGKTGATAERPKAQPMKFTAIVKDVDVKAAKMKSQYGGAATLEGGEIVLQLVVQRPTLPKPPEKSYSLRHEKPRKHPGDAPAPFVEPERLADESDADFKKRVAAAKKEDTADRKSYEVALKAHKDSVARFEQMNLDWEASQQSYRERAAKVGEHFNSYAHLSGLGALLSGLPVSVSLVPDARAMAKFLPGFSPAALMPGLGEANVQNLLEGPAIDDEDEDDDFDDEDDE